MGFAKCEHCDNDAEWSVVTVREERQPIGAGWELSQQSDVFSSSVCEEHLIAALSKNKGGDYHLIHHFDKMPPDSFEYACLMEAAFKKAASYYPESFKYALVNRHEKGEDNGKSYDT